MSTFDTNIYSRFQRERGMTMSFLHIGASGVDFIFTFSHIFQTIKNIT